MSYKPDDEIDLFNLFEILWNGKRIIFLFVTFSFFCGMFFTYTKKPTYESNIAYSIDILPPYYEINQVNVDFKTLFHSSSNFENWKKDNPISTITFEDFSKTKLINGTLFTKNNK